MSDTVTTKQKLAALYRVASYRPIYTVGILTLSLLAAILEGVGVSFLLPIIKQVQQGTTSGNESQLMSIFIDAYRALSIPFTLEYIILGVSIVMVLRYTTTFAVAWLQTALKEQYVRHLQNQAFDNALQASITYFDTEGSDDILNAIITQAGQAGRIIKTIITFIEQGLISLIYLSVALYVTPTLTIATVVFLGIIVVLLRYFLESGYSFGDKVADANERVQSAAQAGTQGIRDVKLFGMQSELSRRFSEATRQYADASVSLNRNQVAMDKIYQLISALAVFMLIYIAIRFTTLSVGGLAVFLFAMFRLAPRASTLNNKIYRIEGELPHVIRTQEFIDELYDKREHTGSERELPPEINRLEFDDVSFAYQEDDKTLRDVTFGVERGEFIAFAGQSGAGKSTIVYLLAQMYQPDSGDIFANNIPITSFDIDGWRSRIAVVRQHPHIFNDTLRYNVAIGVDNVSESEIRRVCELAQVTQFVKDLPNGYDTILGDNGVRLSGGQRQRVAVARALLKDADILILDEATSDLDTKIEETVHRGIEEMDSSQAVIAIAHRLSTVRNADRIYVMSDGEIIETGTHGDLINTDGKYAELHKT